MISIGPIPQLEGSRQRSMEVDVKTRTKTRSHVFPIKPSFSFCRFPKEAQIFSTFLVRPPRCTDYDSLLRLRLPRPSARQTTGPTAAVARRSSHPPFDRWAFPLLFSWPVCATLTSARWQTRVGHRASRSGITSTQKKGATVNSFCAKQLYSGRLGESRGFFLVPRAGVHTAQTPGRS